MSYKGTIQMAIYLVVAVWISCGLLIYSAEKDRNAVEQSYEEIYSSMFSDETSTTTDYDTLYYTTTAYQATETTTEAQTQEQTTVAQESVETTTAVVAQEQDVSEDTGLAVPSTTSEIISAYVNAVNALKAEQNFSLIKTDSLDITIDDMTGATVLSGIANSVIASNTPSGSYYYTFTNGYDSSGATPTSVIAPLNMSASLSESGVLSASATATATGGYVITIYLADELQTLSAPATNHYTTVEVVNLDAVGIPSGTDVEVLNITYSGTIIQTEINSDGKIVSIYHELPVYDAYCEGTYLFVSAFAQIHGLYTSTYQVAY